MTISLIPNTLKKTTTIYLIINDTLQAKFGEKFDCYEKLFDHTSNATHVLAEYQVFVTCDSWYTKAPFISSIKKFENINIIGALRSNTAMFDLNIEKTHKRGNLRKRGKRIDYHNLKYKKDCKFFVAHIKLAVNLIDTPVYITITATDIVKFTSVRLYISIIDPNEINSFDNISIDETKQDKPVEKSTYNIYKIRLNIETIFYQQKTFWSLGNYMVKSKEAINK